MILCTRFLDDVRELVDKVLPVYLSDEDYKTVRHVFERAIESQTEDLAVLFRDLGE